VLPFDNYTGTDTLDYFVAGMHDALIGDIGKISALRVISTTTARTYKTVEKSIPEIAAELNVNTVIESSVLCSGDSVCLRVKALSAYPEEKQLWVQDFKVERSQILNLYNKVTKQISEKINVILTPREESLLAEVRSVDPEAYDAYLKGLYYWDQFTPEAFQLALKYFNKAIEIDPYWAPPYAGMAYYWVAIRQGGLAPNSVIIPKIYEYLNMAYKLDPNSLCTQYVGALISIWTGFNWKKGEEELLDVLEINPNHAFARIYYAHLLSILKRDEEAMKQADLALNLDPVNPMIQSLYAGVASNIGEYDKAIVVAEKALSVAPDNLVALSAMAVAHGYKEDYKSALNYWIDEFQLDEKTSRSILNRYDEKGYEAAAQVLAEEAEKSEFDVPAEIAFIYAFAGNDSKAMDLFEQSYEDHDANLPYIGQSLLFDGPFKIEDPRLFDLLKKLNLPLD
jgi:TolB-like protein/Tfp pilus assembly protein PilF